MYFGTARSLGYTIIYPIHLIGVDQIGPNDVRDESSKFDSHRRKIFGTAFKTLKHTTALRASTLYLSCVGK